MLQFASKYAELVRAKAVPEAMLDTLQRLFQKGVRYRTIIDIGAADGSFAVNLAKIGILADAVPVNIDANGLYEASLKEIASVLGGHYRIGAATDLDGEIELTQSVHPYWSSVRPPDDAYWKRVNGLSAEKVKVPAFTLDHLVQELSLKPPYLLKLDVQGAEESVLRGAEKVLKRTHVVVCEADIDDFQTINARLVDAGLCLYDLTSLARVSDGTLGWFYPIYVSRKLDFVRPSAFWDEKSNAAVIAAQDQRRRAILADNAQYLDRVRRARIAQGNGPSEKAGRNAPCPCGSGKKYKRCCGAHGSL